MSIQLEVVQSLVDYTNAFDSTVTHQDVRGSGAGVTGEIDFEAMRRIWIPSLPYIVQLQHERSRLADRAVDGGHRTASTTSDHVTRIPRPHLKSGQAAGTASMFPVRPWIASPVFDFLTGVARVLDPFAAIEPPQIQQPPGLVSQVLTAAHSAAYERGFAPDSEGAGENS